jgi:zinc protease
MKTLNRKIAPVFNPIKQISMLPAAFKVLNNGLSCYTLTQKGSGICKVEWVFNAGYANQQKPLVAYFTNQLLECGTATMSNTEFNEAMDNYGSFLELQCDQDIAFITLYALKKYIDPSIRLVHEMLMAPTFLEMELERFRNQHLQDYNIQSQKVNTQARRLFLKSYFGETHPYAASVKASDISAVSTEDLKYFYQAFYKNAARYVFVSGDVTDTVDHVLSELYHENQKTIPNEIIPPRAFPGISWFEMPDKIQSALRLGCAWVSRNHPDYFNLQFLNMVLGGYFGSRLMSNIREDKGYTYGIGSSIVNYQNHAFFMISTEIDAANSKDTLLQIQLEIERLQNDRIHESEMEIVRNYLLGNILRQMDGVFNQSELYRLQIQFNLKSHYFQQFADALYAVNSNDILKLAQQYLDVKQFVICGAGKRINV